MFQPEKLGRHNHAFLLASGLVSALINGGASWVLVHYYGLIGDIYLTITPLMLGLTAFLAFYSFQLMISARSALWMLGQGLVRWTRVLLVGMILFFFFLYEDVHQIVLRTMMLQWVIAVLPLQLLLLITLRQAALKINNSPSNRRRAVFVGLGPEALKLAQRLQRSPILGIEIVGYYASQPQPLETASGKVELRYLGNYSDAVPEVEQNSYAIVFVTLKEREGLPDFAALVDRLYDSTGSIYFLPEPRLSEGFSVHGAEIAGVSLLALHETTMLGASRYVKRAMDLLLSGIALVLLSPVMLLAALAVKLSSPGPILYRQKRYGERGKPITVYKFRSMYVHAPQDGVLRQASQGDARVTKVGWFLRRSSLDELPQLFNVLEGTMSLVGPRPHAASHNEFYRHQIRGYMLRHTVKPGITGWAQVNGLRGETDTLDKMQRRVEYDRYYITHWSLGLDIRILFTTVWRLVWDRNAY
ncbi:undecaprenyl-phosphate glucose phosphotransferase [Pusillimonas sp. CC-YST705]|uniref:Undecaprenyl-phosphate glucose phosphotransferase n=1 Tax=Mesopusillimonas faecipullorum TaxID=2755040 RepID=A0ABS8CEU2_9BURK|nr:undecaprenyl-phosphate glucose phosphotransferase [Mesopusillimonas faecipullorum]MCB5364561.1 undecaprenyl-phosphate glucose phosphotransferase [Mesopusillimonas faecipullorum]